MESRIEKRDGTVNEEKKGSKTKSKKSENNNEVEVLCLDSTTVMGLSEGSHI